MTGYFVTGTDTGVGKTAVGCAILAAAERRGLRCAAFKPAESGCDEVEGALFPADAAQLRRAAGGWQSLQDVCLYRYQEPLAPGVAAEASNEDIDFARVRAAVRGADDAQLVIVEGAGGLMVPLGQGLLIIDLIEALELPVIVVARAGLGTINHTLLSLEALQRRELPTAGFVLNCGLDKTPRAAAAANRDEIVRVAGVRCLGLFQNILSANLSALAETGERDLDLDALLEAPRRAS